MRYTALLTIVLSALILNARPATGQPDADAQTRTVEVYLLAGQSNMQGVGKVAELPAGWRALVAGVHFWNGDGFEVLSPGISQNSARLTDFGPELGVRSGTPDA